MKSYRGEPWSSRGRKLYDRNGQCFGEVYEGADNFARTIVECVNLLAGLPVREADGPRTVTEEFALALLRREARRRRREAGGGG
jgi:hypothetical protein